MIRFLIILFYLIRIASSQIVQTGAGSYTTSFPGTDEAGRNDYPSGQPQTTGPALNKHIPTNDWWSSVIKNDHVSNLFNYPMALKTVNTGLVVSYIPWGVYDDQEPIIIGYSMGGLIALILCSRGLGKLGIFITPAAPSGIIAITPSVLRIFIKNIFRWKFWSKPVPPNFPSAYYGVLHDLSREQAKDIFDRSASPESGRALCEMGFPFLDPYGATKVSEQSIKCPTLTIGAGRDRITPIQIARKLKKKLKSKT